MRRLGLATERSTACVDELVAASASRLTNCAIPPLLTRRAAPAGPSAATKSGADSMVVVLTASRSVEERCANAASVPSVTAMAVNAIHHKERQVMFMCPCLEWRIWSRDRSPHVPDWAVVVPEPLLGLLEMTAHDVDELVEMDLRVGIDRVQVVHRDHPRLQVPFVIAHHLVGGFDVRLGLVVFAEHPPVEIRILVSFDGVGVKTKGLMVPDGKRGLLRNIRLEELSAPPAVIDLDQPPKQAVKRAGQYDLFRHAGLHRTIGTLQHVVGSAIESQLEEVQQRRVGGLCWQTLDRSGGCGEKMPDPSAS